MKTKKVESTGKIIKEGTEAKSEIIQDLLKVPQILLLPERTQTSPGQRREIN